MKHSIKFHKIVKNQKTRGIDAFGSGAFGAKRTHGTHQGVDIVTTKGEYIYSPINGVVKRYARPYADDNRFNGIVLTSGDLEIKIFYVNPTIAVGSKIIAGQVIAIAENIGEKFGPKMTPHAHIEARINKRLINPTDLLI